MCVKFDRQHNGQAILNILFNRFSANIFYSYILKNAKEIFVFYVIFHCFEKKLYLFQKLSNSNNVFGVSFIKTCIGEIKYKENYGNIYYDKKLQEKPNLKAKKVNICALLHKFHEVPSYSGHKSSCSSSQRCNPCCCTLRSAVNYDQVTFVIQNFEGKMSSE